MEWDVVGMQFDMLNRPAVFFRNLKSGEVVTVEPYKVIELDADKKNVFGAGYLQGYSDRHRGLPFAAVG